MYDAATAVEEKKGNISKDLFNNIEAISILGVGKNMVSSMRYWALYTGILAVNEDKNLYVTDYAKKISQIPALIHGLKTMLPFG